MTTIYVAIDIPGDPVHAGTLYTHQRGQAQSATFTYGPTYLADPRSYALDPLLPLGAGQFHTPPGRSLFGTFADSTPDRWGRRLVTRAQRAASPSGGASFLSEADYLLGIRDDMRQGALRLQTEPAGEWKAPKSVSIPHRDEPALPARPSNTKPGRGRHR
ncbi:MAG: HipA N-terminal domain-containing protein [Candidatus Nanopelagicales bacterium]